MASPAAGSSKTGEWPVPAGEHEARPAPRYRPEKVPPEDFFPIEKEKTPRP
jgi:hypothetical protein